MYPIRRESTSQSESDSASEEEEEEGIPLLPVGDDSGDSDDTLMKSPRGRGRPKKSDMHLKDSSIVKKTVKSKSSVSSVPPRAKKTAPRRKPNKNLIEATIITENVSTDEPKFTEEIEDSDHSAEEKDVEDEIDSILEAERNRKRGLGKENSSKNIREKVDSSEDDPTLMGQPDFTIKRRKTLRRSQ